MTSLTRAMQAAQQYTRDSTAGQDDMFGGTVPEPGEGIQLEQVDEWPEEDRLAGEKETLGLYLTGHPISQFEQELAEFTGSRLIDLKPNKDRSVVVAGLVVSIRTMSSRRGRMAIMVLDDRSARIEAVLYSEVFQQCRDILTKDRLLIAEGEITLDEVTGGCSMMVQRVLDLDKAREVYAKGVLIRVMGPRVNNGFVKNLRAALEPFRTGTTPVALEYQRGDAVGRLNLGERWKVRPAQELLNRLRELSEAESVEIKYS